VILPLTSGPRLSIGFIEPHLEPVGGIRRVLETGNRLVERGHRVSIYLPDDREKACDWMRCLPRVASVSDGTEDELDFLVFNHEPQWYLLERFERARRTVFLALSHSRLYGKSGSWESLRCAVDLYLANSAWTADNIEHEIGVRPEVVPSGVDTELFRPGDGEREYPVLCVGDRRPWKGTAVIEEACRMLDLPLAKLLDEELSQEQLADRYRRAETFAVGSPLEGFGFPGLEALASGVPLVTTDNGGCREYAVDGETALIVPPDDPAAMAHAISRLRSDPELRSRLVEKGLETARRFSWDEAALGFETALTKQHAAGPPIRDRGVRRPLRAPEPDPLLSVIVLAWNGLELTQRCIESIRQHTDIPYELILVDNGSEDDTPSYAAQAADEPIINATNRGFSPGFNQGLEQARGGYVAFLNNDTQVPPGWASRLASTLEQHPEAGAVFPAVTAAANPLTVRSGARDRVEVVPPFQEPPSGVALVMRTAVARELGGWGEEYRIAAGEDTDLCFKLWVNGLDILVDEGALVDHVGKASAKRLPDWKRHWAVNRALFLDKWTGALDDVPRLASCSEEAFARNKGHARGVAFWMARYFRQRDRALLEGRKDRAAPAQEPSPAATRAAPSRVLTALPRALVRRLWERLRGHVPAGLRVGMYRRFRKEYEHFFPERIPARPAPEALAPQRGPGLPASAGPAGAGDQGSPVSSDASSPTSSSSSASISR
jgi:glycosyltransferase involved in cell wall biosynthesis/GT2 family glycosyltransferase